MAKIVINTPAGECPVRLTSIEPRKVLAWLDAVHAIGERQGRVYTDSAIKYFVRQFYSFHDPEYQTVCRIIDAEKMT